MLTLADLGQRPAGGCPDSGRVVVGERNDPIGGV